MKKVWAFVLTLAVLLGMAGCGVEDSQPTPEPTPSVATTPTPTSTQTPTPTPPPTVEDIFHRYFNHSAGVGGWSTELFIEDDGTFTGGYFAHHIYSENEGWELYVCEFSGRFSEPQKVNEYTYSMQLEELTIELAQKGLEGTDLTQIEERTAPGIEGGEEFLIYMPGTPMDELPEEAAFWACAAWGGWDEKTLQGYEIYNVKEELGFFSHS